MKVQYIYLKENEIKDEIDFQWDRLLKKFTKMYGTENIPCCADVTVHELNHSSFIYEVDDYSDCVHFSVKEKISMTKTSNTIEIKKETSLFNYEFNEYTNETETELMIFTQPVDGGMGIDKDKLKKLQKNHEDSSSESRLELADFE